MPSGLIFDIKRYSVHDGPGIRTTVFFKGCPLTCWWCHNPESRAAGPLLFYDAEKCLGCHDCVAACAQGAVTASAGGSLTDDALCRGDGACVAVCPTEARQLVGRRYSVDELIRHSNEKNLDGATLAFTQMTLSCVNCHQQLRED